MLALLFVVTGIIARIIPHLPNFTPVGAAALFGGAYLPKKWALIMPILIMVVSDLVIGFDGFFSRAYVYGSFLLIGLLGLWLRTHKSTGNIILVTFSSSVLFFALTNFGVWAHSTMYEKSLNGLMHSYMMGLPYFRYTLLGDFFYTGVFFGAYGAASYYLKKTKLARLVDA